MSNPFRMTAAVSVLLLLASAPLAAAGETEAAIVVELLLRSGASTLKRVSSKPLCIQADPPEIYREPFISGTGKLTRVVSLEYRLRLQRNDARGLLIELTPISNRFTPPRHLELPRDGRSRLHSVWRDDASGSEALFSIRLAEPDEALLACTLRRPLIRPLYHLRATIEQSGTGPDPSRSSPRFTAPMGEESSEHFVNTQPRKIERKKTGPEAGPALLSSPQPVLSPGVTVREFGESGAAAPQSTTVPLVNPEPAATPPTPSPVAAPTIPTAADKPVTAPPPEPPEVVIVEDRDDFIVTVKADREGERLKIRVTATGSLGTLTERRVAVNMNQTYTVFRHEPMSLYITGEGALHSYSMSFDPDWEDQ